MKPALSPQVDPDLLDGSLWTDRAIVDGPLPEGYAEVPLSLILDRTFSDAAFKLYTYYSGLAAQGETEPPSVEEQRRRVGYGKKKFLAARKEIEERGLFPFPQNGSSPKAGDLS